MRRATIPLIVIAVSAASLHAQQNPAEATAAIAVPATYRVDIHSPAPRGTWAALISIKAGTAGYEGAFRDPDGPGSYPVASIALRGDSLIVTMGGEATGSVFYLQARNDSLVGMMTSVAHGDTRVTGVRQRP